MKKKTEGGGRMAEGGGGRTEVGGRKSEDGSQRTVRPLASVLRPPFSVLLLLALTARAEFTNGTPRVHEFVYPTNDITPQTVVFIYTNSNPALALTNSLGQTLWPLWRVVTNLDTVTGTNNSPVRLSLPQMYFVARASNEWGLGSFSIVLRSAPPREDVSQVVR